MIKKRIKEVLVIISLCAMLSACVTGCAGQGGTAAALTPKESTAASMFPTLPSVIDDSDFRAGLEEQDPGAVWISYDWTDYFPGMEPPECDWAAFSEEEQRQWLEEYGTFCWVTNAEAEQLEISVLGPEAFGRTTMQVLGTDGSYQTKSYAVPYSASYSFSANQDDRPRNYDVHWVNARYGMRVQGEHLGDVRITAGGISFSGEAEHYKAASPQNFTISVTFFGEETMRKLSVSGAETDACLLTRAGNRWQLLCSHSCRAVISDDDRNTGYKTLVDESVPAGTSWYVEDLTAPAEALKTGLLP